MVLESPLATLAMALAVLAAACAQNRYACPPAPVPRPVNVDSLYASAAPLRSYSDTSLPRDSIVGIVLRAGARSLLRNAEVRLSSDTTVRVHTDSTGRFALPAPAANQIVLETRLVGYLRRHDALQVVQLQHKRLEVTLLDAYVLGDIQPVLVCVPDHH